MQVAGPQTGADGHERLGTESGELLTQFCGGGDDDLPQRVDGCGVGLDGAVSGHSERSDGLHDTVAGLRYAAGGPGLDAPCSGYRVGGIGLADPASGTTVRLVDLDDLDPAAGQVTGQAGTVGACPLDTDLDDVAVLGKPAEQVVVSHPGGGKGRVPEQTTEVIQGSGGVGVGVGIDPASDLACAGVVSSMVCTVLSLRWDGTQQPVGRTAQ